MGTRSICSQWYANGEFDQVSMSLRALDSQVIVAGRYCKGKEDEPWIRVCSFKAQARSSGKDRNVPYIGRSRD